MNMQSIYTTSNTNENSIERTVIDLAGVKSGMLAENFVRYSKDLANFEQPKNGLPILIPCIPSMFENYEKFVLKCEDIKRLIFGPVNSDYIGCKLALAGDTFLSKFRIKSAFQKKVDTYTKEILSVRKRIKTLVEEFTLVGAFQTRNIPHLGHEKIIGKMLEHCELVVINPVVGPKKQGDIDSEKLRGLYDSVLKPRYQKRIEFLPIRANMFYAGPREAIHHARLRQWLGFTHFTVGRDHAGAEGIYEDTAAVEMIRKIQDQLSIKIITHGGAFHCSICDKVVLQNDCNHSKKILTEISGSDFRFCLNMKKNYPFAALDVQKWASKNFEYLQL